MTTKLIARGRNGNFKLEGFIVSTIEGVNSIKVGIYSNRIGGRDPIEISGPINQVKNLFQMIQDELNTIQSI